MVTNMKKIATLLLSVLLISGMFYGCSPSEKELTTKPDDLSVSEPEITNNQTEDTTSKPSQTEGSTNDTTKKTTEGATKKVTTTKEKTTKQIGNLSVSETMDALQNYFGDDYEVTGISSEGENYSFAVYKGNTHYASVTVNLKTGDTQITMTESGKKDYFNLFV